MKRNILIPCAGYEDYSSMWLLWDLMFIEPSEWSIREHKWIQEAMNNGILYHATHEVMEDSFKLTSDLGDPNDKFSIEFPNFVSLKLAAITMATAVDKLMGVLE